MGCKINLRNPAGAAERITFRQSGKIAPRRHAPRKRGIQSEWWL